MGNLHVGVGFAVVANRALDSQFPRRSEQEPLSRQLDSTRVDFAGPHRGAMLPPPAADVLPGPTPGVALANLPDEVRSHRLRSVTWTHRELHVDHAIPPAGALPDGTPGDRRLVVLWASGEFHGRSSERPNTSSRRRRDCLSRKKATGKVSRSLRDNVPRFPVRRCSTRRLAWWPIRTEFLDIHGPDLRDGHCLTLTHRLANTLDLPFLQDGQVPVGDGQDKAGD